MTTEKGKVPEHLTDVLEDAVKLSAGVDTAEEFLEEKANLPEVIAELVDGVDFGFERGQYWANGDKFVALVLMVNEFAVIYQALMNIGPDNEAVFDFEQGQELSTLDGFRAFLEGRGAKLVDIPKHLVEQSLLVYQGKLTAGKIFKSKTLPRNSESAFELREYERYRIEKRIIPPPVRDRSKRALHWLLTGNEMMSCKLWDPNLDNWVLPDGRIDTSAGIGFVRGYHSMAALPLSETGAESFEDFSNRLVELLRKNGFFFDERFIRGQLAGMNPENTSVEEHLLRLASSEPVPHYIHPNVPNSDDKTLTMPVYDFAFRVGPFAFFEEEKVLVVHLVLNNKVIQTIVFPEVRNSEFLPNNDLTLYHYE